MPSGWERLRFANESIVVEASCKQGKSGHRHDVEPSKNWKFAWKEASNRSFDQMRSEFTLVRITREIIAISIQHRTHCHELSGSSIYKFVSIEEAWIWFDSRIELKWNSSVSWPSAKEQNEIKLAIAHRIESMNRYTNDFDRLKTKTRHTMCVHGHQLHISTDENNCKCDSDGESQAFDSQWNRTSVRREKQCENPTQIDMSPIKCSNPSAQCVETIWKPLSAMRKRRIEKKND